MILLLLLERGRALFPIVNLVLLIRPCMWEMINKCLVNGLVGKTKTVSGNHIPREVWLDNKKLRREISEETTASLYH